MSKDNGGPAFPGSIDHGLNGVESHSGMTLRQYLICHAPASEIEDMCPQDIAGCAEYIGIPVEEYKGRIHYKQVLAKARGEWADAMLKERAK